MLSLRAFKIQNLYYQRQIQVSINIDYKLIGIFFNPHPPDTHTHTPKKEGFLYFKETLFVYFKHIKIIIGLKRFN